MKQILLDVLAKTQNLANALMKGCGVYHFSAKGESLAVDNLIGDIVKCTVAVKYSAAYVYKFAACSGIIMPLFCIVEIRWS